METRPTMRFIRKQIEGRMLDAERCGIFGCLRCCDTGESLGKIMKSLTPTAMTNARFAAFHGVSVALAPLDQTRSTPQITRSSRAGIGQSRSSGVLPSGTAVGVSLRLRSARRYSPPSAPLPARRARPKF